MKSLAEVASVVCNVGLAVSTKYTLQTDRQTRRQTYSGGSMHMLLPRLHAVRCAIKKYNI